MYVCVSVCNRFTIEIYGFMHSLRIFWHILLRMSLRDDMEQGMEIEVEDSEQRPNESRCMEDAQQKDERQQDNSDTNRLVHHHPSNLLRSLTCERIGGGQHGVVSPALRATPFRSFHVLRMRHLMRMLIPSKMQPQCAQQPNYPPILAFSGGHDGIHFGTVALLVIL